MKENKKNIPRKTIYYENELTDDFAKMGIEIKPLRENYRYIHRGPLWRLFSFILYRIIGQPLAWLYTKIVPLHRFKNKKAILKVGISGAYVYANHTNFILDAFLPNLLRHFRRGYIVVGPDTMSISGINNIVEMLGAIPLGSTIKQKKEMVRCVKTRIRQRNLITIYPEAHMWPYYTGIRPFTDASFSYPAHTGTPVFAMTTCYQKRKIGSFPKTVTFIDGPFYPDESLPVPERKKVLRDQCYNAMKARAEENSTYEYIAYRKKEDVENKD